MTKPELEKKIFLHLTKVEFSTLDEMVKLFHCTKENLMDIIKNNTKTQSEPLGFILADKQKTPNQYSIEPANYETIHLQINNYLKGIDGILKLCYQNFSIQSIFENNANSAINFTDKGRQILDNVSLILDRIQQLSFVVSYYKSINGIPENMIFQADEDHKKCLDMYSQITQKLKKIDNANDSHQQAIELYLFKHQFVVNHLKYSI